MPQYIVYLYEENSTKFGNQGTQDLTFPNKEKDALKKDLSNLVWVFDFE